MRFEFATATRVVFGARSRLELPTIAAALGSRALVVTGRSPSRSELLVSGLTERGVRCVLWSVPGEPTIDQSTGQSMPAQVPLNPAIITSTLVVTP